MQTFFYFEYLTRTCGYKDPKLLPTGKWAAIYPLIFTHAIITGKMGDMSSYDDRWCYHNYAAAKKALDEWDGTGEPKGWHRHPFSGRRQAEDGSEYVML